MLVLSRSLHSTEKQHCCRLLKVLEVVQLGSSQFRCHIRVLPGLTYVHLFVTGGQCHSLQGQIFFFSSFNVLLYLSTCDFVTSLHVAGRALYVHMFICVLFAEAACSLNCAGPGHCWKAYVSFSVLWF